MAPDDPADLELMLYRFHRLMNEVIRGATARNTFQPWELELLLDFQSCELNSRRRMDTLRRYEKAVARQLSTRSGPPMKLSEFLARVGRVSKPAQKDDLPEESPP